MTPAAQLSILLTLKDLASGPLSRFGEVMQQTSTRLVAMGESGRIAGRAMMDMMRGPVMTFCLPRARGYQPSMGLALYGVV